MKSLHTRTLSVLCTLVSTSVLYAHELGSNKKPSWFGEDQTIYDIRKVAWEPLEVEGLAPGAEILMLRGDLEVGDSQFLLRLPPNYSVPNRSHTSD